MQLCVCKAVCAAKRTCARYFRESLVHNLELEWIMWVNGTRVNYTELVPTFKLVRRAVCVASAALFSKRRRVIRGHHTGSVTFGLLIQLTPSTSLKQAPLIRIQFHFLAYVEKTGWRALGLDALSWIFNCHQPSEAEVSWGGGGWVTGCCGYFSRQCKHTFLSPSHPTTLPSTYMSRTRGCFTTHLLHPSICPSIPHSSTLLLCAVMLSDAPPPSSPLPSWLASSSVACHGGCAPSKLIDSSFFQKDVAGYQCALRSPATGGAWLAGRLLKTAIPPLMPPSWKFRIVSAKTPYAK